MFKIGTNIFVEQNRILILRAWIGRIYFRGKSERSFLRSIMLHLLSRVVLGRALGVIFGRRSGCCLLRRASSVKSCFYSFRYDLIILIFLINCQTIFLLDGTLVLIDLDGFLFFMGKQQNWLWRCCRPLNIICFVLNLYLVVSPWFDFARRRRI